MKIATFTADGVTRIGVVGDAEIIDLSEAAPELPREMTALLEAGPDALARAADAAARAKARRPLADVRLESPILRPPRRFSTLPFPCVTPSRVTPSLGPIPAHDPMKESHQHQPPCPATMRTPV